MPKYRREKKIQQISLFLFFLLITFAGRGFAGVPTVTDITVTDVTSRSFSVIWSASEPSTSGLTVYDDADGFVQTVGAVVTSQPVNNGSTAIQSAAENNGVMKVRVIGLHPNTTYYFKTITTSKSTLDVVSFPETTPLPGVTTETRTVRTEIAGVDEIPFTNDLITFECYLPGGVTPAEGTLLVAGVEGCNYPVSNFVGDGVPNPLAYADLNNLFNTAGHGNVPLVGGEELLLTQFMGIGGIQTATYTIPINNQLAEMKFPAAIPCYGDLDGDNDVDGVDLAIFVEAYNSVSGEANYNPDADIDGSGAVDEGDLDLFIGNFGKADCQ